MYVQLKPYYLNIIENFGLYSPTYFQSVSKKLYIYTNIFYVCPLKWHRLQTSTFDEHYGITDCGLFKRGVQN